MLQGGLEGAQNCRGMLREEYGEEGRGDYKSVSSEFLGPKSLSSLDPLHSVHDADDFLQITRDLWRPARS